MRVSKLRNVPGDSKAALQVVKGEPKPHRGGLAGRPTPLPRMDATLDALSPALPLQGGESSKISDAATYAGSGNGGV